MKRWRSCATRSSSSRARCTTIRTGCAQPSRSASTRLPASANHAGPGAHGKFLGASRIVDSRESVIAAADSGDEVVCADLDAAEVDEARDGDDGGHIYFADRRPELCGEISRPVE